MFACVHVPKPQSHSERKRLFLREPVSFAPRSSLHYGLDGKCGIFVLMSVPCVHSLLLLLLSPARSIWSAFYLSPTLPSIHPFSFSQRDSFGPFRRVSPLISAPHTLCRNPLLVLPPPSPFSSPLYTHTSEGGAPPFPQRFWSLPRGQRVSYRISGKNWSALRVRRPLKDSAEMPCPLPVAKIQKRLSFSFPPQRTILLFCIASTAARRAAEEVLHLFPLSLSLPSSSTSKRRVPFPSRKCFFPLQFCAEKSFRTRSFCGVGRTMQCFAAKKCLQSPKATAPRAVVLDLTDRH